jgi:hypothetical protein
MCPDKTIACDVPNEHQPEAELSEHERLTRALDAAQDEIERLISEKEALRAERDDIQHRFDITWAYAKPNPASAPGGGS